MMVVIISSTDWPASSSHQLTVKAECVLQEHCSHVQSACKQNADTYDENYKKHVSKQTWQMTRCSRG